MKYTSRLLFLASLVLTFSGATRAEAKKQGATVEKVLDFYRTEEFLDDCLHHVEEAIDRRKKELSFDDALAKRMKDVAARIYVKKNLFNVFKVAYAKATTLENMTALWDWMNSPRGLLLKRAYGQQYENKRYKDWKAYFDKESPTLLKPNRKNAITTFQSTFELWELETTKVLGSDFAVWWTINQSSAHKESLRFIKNKIKQRKQGFIEPARTYYDVFDFSLLRDLKNDEIDELSKFASTVVGQSATKAFRTALEQTLENAGKTLANEIAKGTK